MRFHPRHASPLTLPAVVGIVVVMIGDRSRGGGGGVVGVLGFQSSEITPRSRGPQQERSAVQLREARANRPLAGVSADKKRRCDPCENPFDDDDSVDLDRREAAFAMVGALWAATTGVGGAAAAAGGSLLFGNPQPSNAATGDSANILLPNPYAAMADRANKQCLVESLGNRECLLYADDGAKIYQGADSKVLLGRVERASAALATIPQLIAEKKWSKVTGVMTGPMGELILTMGQLADLSENGDAARSKIKALKNSLYAINAAVGQKDGAKALKSHEAATNNLVAFVKAL